MTAPKVYNTPEGFKVALEDRLKRRAASANVQVNRVRQRFIMERFLARIATEFGSAFMLKGGLALELRLAEARSTKDIDLQARGDPDGVIDRLRRAAANDLGDRLGFQVVPDPEHPDIEDAVYEGRRFRVVASIASKSYGSPFGVDVGIGDAVHGIPDTLTGEDYLGFVGVAPITVPVYPVETHVAEKLHAYSRPPRSGRVNSRVRDLPDLALLATVKEFDAVVLRAALERTFAFRATHPLPNVFPDAPAQWVETYRALAAEHDLRWQTLEEVHAAAQTFLGPVLARNVGQWDRERRRWVSSGAV